MKYGLVSLRRLYVLLLGMGAAIPSMVLAQGDPAALLIQQAMRVSATDSAHAARDVLLEFELDLAGNPQYDFALAEVTRQIGADAEAEVLYERVVSTDPLHAEAWMQLGVYAFQQRDKAKLYDIVGQLEALEPPAAAANVIDSWYRWLGVFPTVRNGHWLSVGVGADTNINLGPADDRFTDFEIELTSGSVAKSSGFTELGAGLYGGGSSGFGKARLFRLALSKTQFGADAADQQLYSGTLKWVSGNSKRQLDTTLGYLRFQNDLDEQYESIAADIRFRWWLNYRQKIALSAGHVVRRFDKGDGQLHVRDADRWRAGLDWSYQADASNRLVAALGWYQDRPEQSNSPFEQRGHRLVLSWQYRSNRGFQRSIFWAHNQAKYRNTDSAFGREREEITDALGMRMNWIVSKPLGLWGGFEIQRQDRNANIDVFDYERLKWQFSLQWRT